MKRTCPICKEPKANLWTHLDRVHHMKGEDRKELIEFEKYHRYNKSGLTHNGHPSERDKCEPFHLKHPFTCMVSGMTGCGKTTWVQRLLRDKAHTIQPTPQRIVWCYSRWQPAYTEMIQAIPDIEFVRGIPANIEHDEFFDVSVRNLIVIDDQMSTASNDKQVINLFTQGSHHRNLSVIYLVQNLFHQGKGNRDISLNCHYLVIFKNPRDQLQILTLAKQMYPRKTKYFLEKYEEAVSRPFGYLFIDLKTTTPDHCRLRTNVLPGEEDQRGDAFERSELSRELTKHLRQQNLSLPPTVLKLRNLQGQMDDLLKNPNLNTDQKTRQYVQLQNNFVQFKKKTDSSSAFPQATLMSDDPPIHFIPPEPEQIEHEPSWIEPDDLAEVSSEEEDEPTLFASALSPQIHTSALLTPPDSATMRKSLKKARFVMKNYLDSDSQTSFGPYSNAAEVRRSRRLKGLPIYKPY